MLLHTNDMISPPIWLGNSDVLTLVGDVMISLHHSVLHRHKDSNDLYNLMQVKNLNFIEEKFLP